MAEEKRTENSTLFSLRELQKIEDDRVEQQKQAEVDRASMERRAREDEQRRRDRVEFKSCEKPTIQWGHFSIVLHFGLLRG